MKAELRRKLRAARRALAPKEHAERSKRAAAAVRTLAAFKSGSRVAIYWPFDRETDTGPLLAAAAQRGVRIFIPVITDLRRRRMEFHPLSGEVRRGAFGICVPHRTRTATAARWFDLIVVPLVGVDGAGHRLGMGGGFYDRALAFRRGRRYWRGPTIVGLAFDCQRTDASFADDWDVSLDCLATETGMTYFPKGE